MYISAMQRSGSTVLRGEWFGLHSALIQVRICYLVRWAETECPQGLSVIFVTGKRGHCVMFRHLGSELESVSCPLDAMSTTCNGLVEMSVSLQEHSPFESLCIHGLKELSHGQCWEILERWHVDYLMRFWETTQQAFRQTFAHVSLPREACRCYLDADIVLDSHFNIRLLRTGRCKSYEDRAQSQNWLSSPPSMDRSRHIWLSQVLVQFYLGLPLTTIDFGGRRVSKAAYGGNRGLDYFIYLHLKHFEKRVSADVRVHLLEPLPSDMGLTQRCLCAWWGQKLQNGMRHWPGFRMDEGHIHDLSVRAVFYASLQMSTWREFNLFAAAVSPR